MTLLQTAPVGSNSGILEHTQPSHFLMSTYIPSINLTEGVISFGSKAIRTVSDDGVLDSLAEEGLLEKRETERGNPYYYVECTSGDMRFGIYISLRAKRISWLRLQWLDSPIQGWDDVSEEALRDEYRELVDFVKQSVGRGPNSRGNGTRTWRLKWGLLEVIHDVRALQVSVFMLTRWGAGQERWLFE